MTTANTNSTDKSQKSNTKPTKKSSRKQNIITLVAESQFIKEFREFINRGNMVDLAIGVAVGGAFTAIVKSLVDDIIMPISSLLAGGLDFSQLSIDIPNIFGADSTAHIAYGNFLQNVVNFLLVAFVVFIMIRAINRFNRQHPDPNAKDTNPQSKNPQTDSAKK